MPAWTRENLTPPWPKPHRVQLAPPETYDAAHQLQGSDNLRKHRPGGLVARDGGELGRRAGMYGMMHADSEEQVPMMKKPALTGDDDGGDEDVVELDWHEKLRSGDTFASVRDIKKASTE